MAVLTNSLRLAGSARGDSHGFRTDFSLLKSTTLAQTSWNQVALESRIRFEKGLHLLLVTWLTVELQVPKEWCLKIELCPQIYRHFHHFPHHNNCHQLGVNPKFGKKKHSHIHIYIYQIIISNSNCWLDDKCEEFLFTMVYIIQWSNNCLHIYIYYIYTHVISCNHVNHSF
jgi:hypothetical protein